MMMIEFLRWKSPKSGCKIIIIFQNTRFFFYFFSKIQNCLFPDLQRGPQIRLPYPDHIGTPLRRQRELQGSDPQAASRRSHSDCHTRTSDRRDGSGMSNLYNLNLWHKGFLKHTFTFSSLSESLHFPCEFPSHGRCGV